MALGTERHFWANWFFFKFDSVYVGGGIMGLK